MTNFTIGREMIDFTLTYFADDPEHINLERFIKLLREFTERSARLNQLERTA
jgi:hypothetical protein